MITAVLLLFGTCSQEPLSPTKDPRKYTGSWSSPWVLYDDVLNTLGGDVLYYPSNPGPAIMFLDNVMDGTSYSGEKYFHFTWNGGAIYWAAQPPNNPTNCYEHSFAGYSLITTSNPVFYDMAQPLDLTDSHYTKITFYMRGKLAQGYLMKFEGPNNAVLDNVTPTSSWTKYEVTLKDLNNVKDYFKVTIKYPPAETGSPAGTGGYVDVDCVAYEK